MGRLAGQRGAGTGASVFAELSRKMADTGLGLEALGCGLRCPAGSDFFSSSSCPSRSRDPIDLARDIEGPPLLDVVWSLSSVFVDPDHSAEETFLKLLM